MSLTKTSNRCFFLIGSVIGAASIVAGWFVYKRRLRLSKGRQIEKKLRQIIDRQLCFGQPCTTTVVVSNVDEWNAIEERFLHTIDSTRTMGLDCEWLTEGKTTGKVQKGVLNLFSSVDPSKVKKRPRTSKVSMGTIGGPLNPCIRGLNGHNT